MRSFWTPFCLHTSCVHRAKSSQCIRGHGFPPPCVYHPVLSHQHCCLDYCLILLTGLLTSASVLYVFLNVLIMLVFHSVTQLACIFAQNVCVSGPKAKPGQHPTKPSARWCPCCILTSDSLVSVPRCSWNCLLALSHVAKSAPTFGLLSLLLLPEGF